VVVGWPDILDALGLKEHHKEWVRGLNNRSPERVIKFRRGAKPIAELGALIQWWQDLVLRYEDLKAREAANEETQTHQEATLTMKHSYGRNGAVFPEIAGYERTRRNRNGQ
jgi:hypothetical protein